NKNYVNNTVRKRVGGVFVQLPSGLTHYELGGPAKGKPVVLIHGFSVPYFIWDPTFDFLVKSGFRVLRYDLFGRGFSDRPRVRYNLDLFCKQLIELLDTLGLTQPVTLFGLSMGGPIAAAAAERYPERVERLVLIDPAGVQPIGISPLLKLTLLPGLGELALGLFGSASMVKGIASDFFGPELVEQFQARYRVQMQYSGFMRAILSTMRNGMLGSFLDVYRRVGKLDKPTLLLWGREDKTVPFAHSADLLSAIPHAELHVFEHCGHIPHYEKAEEVNPLLLKFLKLSR
ncbi:MAG: alpha/beta hydrolase, partial [Chloroflexota bacterium]